MSLLIGIIGYKNHALRLIKLIEEHKFCELGVIYHPKKMIDADYITNKFEELYQCDAVIISSPNETHFDYIIKLLENFKGYVFCEKLPVCSLPHIDNLLELDNRDKYRIYFNYNFRYSYLNDILEQLNDSGDIGDVQHINMITGHGLAFKECYVNSWRADGENNLHSITETLAIHYLDLLKLNYGKIDSFYYNPNMVSGVGSAYDTVQISLKFNTISACIFASYASPYTNEIFIVGTNGTLKISNDILYLYGPRDTTDKDGNFIAPPLIKTEEINMENDYKISLSRSFDFFINHVHKNSNINIKYFNEGLSSNKFLLEMQNNANTMC